MSDSNPDKTRLIRRSSPSSDYRPQPPMRSGHDPEETIYAPGTPGDYRASPDETRIIGRNTPGVPPEPPPRPTEDHTVLVRPSSNRPKGQTGEPAANDDFLPNGPVVGWLVVVGGPGKGSSITLGYGMNSIGRDADNRVPIPFGDEQISRKKHATLVYDPRGRKYYLQHGDSSNLTYVGETPVLEATMLSGGETIRIGGETELRFVPLCGEDFDWERLE